MAQRTFRHLPPDVLLIVEPVEADAAAAVATAPGGVDGSRFPVFVDLSARPGVTLQDGGHACLEFILPGRPGRWRAAGQVARSVPEGVGGVPRGVCLELLGLTLTGETSAEPDMVEAADDEAAPGFDPLAMELEAADVTGMLSDLLGREVKAVEGPAIGGEIPGDAVVAAYRDDDGVARFAIALDKPAAARVGGALTMLPPQGIAEFVNGRAPLEGEPLENAAEVLNIMSALFHEAGAPHVVLAETQTEDELRAGGEPELVALLDDAIWSLAVGLDVEEYGAGEVLLLAVAGD